MKTIYLVLLYVVTSTASALPLVRPALPQPSPYADTESVTNVAFCAGVPGDNVFSLSLALDASPSNNVEVASVNAEEVVKFGATKEPLTIRIR